MYLIVCFLISIIVLQIADANPISICNPNLKIPDSRSCSTYYTCVQNGDYWGLKPNECPDTLLFDPATNECRVEYEVKCPIRAATNDIETRDLKYSSNNRQEDFENKLKSKRAGRLVNKNGKKSGTKSRKNKLNKKKNKNWVAIFVRGCSSKLGSPYDDDDGDEQVDEQMEELEDEHNNLDDDTPDKGKNDK